MDRGYLIVFEGIDKSGKETQSKLLANYLDARGIRIHLYSFPNYFSDSGHLIRDYLTGKQKFSQRTINMIYSVNRYEMRELIQKHLDEGAIVILDRYYYSNMAYGTAPEEGVTMEGIEMMDSEMPEPDLVIYINISPEESFRRSGKDTDKNENNIGLLRQARGSYYALFNFKEVGNNWIEINGEESQEEIHDQIVEIVKNRILNK